MSDIRSANIALSCSCLVDREKEPSMRLRLSKAAPRLLCILLLSGSIFAQSERGTISGTVHDTSGAVIPAAQVTVTNTATNAAVNVATREAGHYPIPSLPVRPDNELGEMQGFRRAQVTGSSLQASRKHPAQ